jgi:hypothetical protein
VIWHINSSSTASNVRPQKVKYSGIATGSDSSGSISDAGSLVPLEPPAVFVHLTVANTAAFVQPNPFGGNCVEKLLRQVEKSAPLRRFSLPRPLEKGVRTGPAV